MGLLTAFGVGVTAALSSIVPAQCTGTPEPSSPVNCVVKHENIPGQEYAYGIRCDAGAYDGTTQYRIVLKFRQCGQPYCVEETLYGDWVVPSIYNISIQVIPKITYPYATLSGVGYQRR